MFILDSLLVGGLRFVLDTIATAADHELNDADALRDQLLAAQMRVELGEMSPQEFAEIERVILRRLREIRGGEEEAASLASGEFRVTGATVETED
jgi:hypothetical protein